MGAICTPESAAGPPPSKFRMWHEASPITSSPGRQWTRMEISLHIVPDGRKTAASLPSRAAIRSQSALTLGSEKDCSSPTGASAIAWRISGVGWVWVSL